MLNIAQEAMLSLYFHEKMRKGNLQNQRRWGCLYFEGVPHIPHTVNNMLKCKASISSTIYLPTFAFGLLRTT